MHAILVIIETKLFSAEIMLVGHFTSEGPGGLALVPTPGLRSIKLL